MDLIIEIILINFLAFFIRIPFAFGAANDNYVHLWNYKFISHEKDWKKDISNSVIKGYKLYPILGHKLIALFPEKYWKTAALLLNIFWDIVFINITYFTAYYIAQTINIDSFTYVSFPSVITLLVAISPVLLGNTSRMRAFGSRSFGLFLSMLFLISLYYTIFSVNVFPISISIVFSLLLLIIITLSSQFAFQFSLFTLIGLISITFSLPLIIILVVFVFLLLFDKKHTGLNKFFIGKLDHYRWYFKNLNKGTQINDRNKIKDILLLPYYVFAKPSKVKKILFFDSSILILLLSLPQIFFIVILYFKFNSEFLSLIHQNSFYQYSAWLVLITSVIFILTSIRPLIIFGQAERYFEYVLFYVNFIFLVLLFHFGYNLKWLIYLVLFQVIVSILHITISNFPYLKEKLSNKLNADLSELVNFLNQYKKSNVLTIPSKFSFLVSYHLYTNHKYYYGFIITQQKGFKYMDEDHESYGLPKNNFEYFKKKYNINIIVLSKNTVYNNKKVNYLDEINKYTIIFENKEYIVISI